MIPSLKKLSLTAAIFLLLFFMISCSQTIKPAAAIGYAASPTPVLTPPANGAKASVINYIYTVKRGFVLTFSNMADEQTMESILNELDRYDIKALFYLQGIRVAEEADIAKDILSRGHMIGNDGAKDADLTKLSYSEAYNEIKLGSQIIQEKTGVTPKYLWNHGGKYNDTVLMAANANGLTFVKYNINMEALKSQSDQQIQSYLENKITRGGILSLGTEDLDFDLRCIRLIAKVEQEMNYSVMPIDYLLANTYERKPLEDIPGWDSAQVNQDYQGTPYEMVQNGSPDKKIVVLTFDDWGGDYSITRLLDILDKDNIKATFFLRGNGIEANPNLAMAISQDGMDIGNHSYSHQDFTKMTPEEIEEDIVHCHQVLTEAIQKPPAMLFRPPYGLANESAAQAIAATGYKYIALYNLTPDDWDIADNHDAAYITDYIKDHSANGSIILLHLMIQLDTYKALPQVIQYLLDQGYSFETMSQLIDDGDAVTTADLTKLSNSE